MLKKVLFIFVVCFLCFGNIQSQSTSRRRKNRTEATTTARWPELYRDHVYYELSNKGKDMFYAVNIHPDCVAKKGNCIPRKRCIAPQMLYISRVCYKWDLVCCYDNTIKFPEVAWKFYSPPPPPNITHNVYIEPPPEP